MKRVTASAACTAACIALVSLTLTPVYASTNTEAEEVLAALASVDAGETEMVTAPLEGNYEGDVATDEPTLIEDVAITLPFNTDGRITILNQPNDSAISMELPASEEQSDASFIAENILAYDHGNSSQTIPIVKDDGSVQVNTYIESQSAPTRFNYEFTLPEGARIQEFDGGSLYFVDEDESILGGVAPAWAVDAAGTSVPTRYEVDGHTITQVVDHGAEHSYPIVADPLWGKALINSVSWINRNGVVSQSISPTGWNRFNLGFGPAISEGWKEAIAKTPSRSLNGRTYNRTTANTTQMYWQYRCHQVGAFFKGSWNLEPSKYRSTYQAYVAKLCN